MAAVIPMLLDAGAGNNAPTTVYTWTTSVQSGIDNASAASANYRAMMVFTQFL